MNKRQSEIQCALLFNLLDIDKPGRTIGCANYSDGSFTSVYLCLMFPPIIS